jgi:hypothetical protein
MHNFIDNCSNQNNDWLVGDANHLGNSDLAPSIFDDKSHKSAPPQLTNISVEDYLNQTILPLAQTSLREFVKSPDAIEKMNLAFGNGFDRSKGKQVIDSFLTGESLPIEIISIDQMLAKGAFDGEKIYLSQELTANPQEAVNVLLEEIGHYIDSQVNNVDSAGDEGAIFAKLVQNESFAPGELAALQAENDKGILDLNGQAIEVEQSSLDPGVFIVDSKGKISIDFLADSSGTESEMAIFSLKGMENLEAGSTDFIQEAARRALSNSKLGRIVIKDAIEGAKFNGDFGEGNKNYGNYGGIKTFNFTPGDRVAIMLVPHGTVREVFKNPKVSGNKRPFFSLSEANPDRATQLGQLVPGTFAWEDRRVNARSKSDYNDILFQIKGATGHQRDLGQLIVASGGKDWQGLPFAKQILNYVYQDKKPPIIDAGLAEDSGLDDRLFRDKYAKIIYLA